MFAQNCTTADGRVTALTTYAPYGTVLTSTGTSHTTYGYTGEQVDAVTGLLYLRARYYNSALHTFTGRDPWAGNSYSPQTLHGYTYAYNNPVRLVDPTGYCGGDPRNNNLFDISGNMHLDCTFDNFQTSPIEERLRWINSLMDKPGVGGWFNNIAGIIQGFVDFEKSDPGTWISYVDAAILHGIQDGYQLSRRQISSSSAVGANEWKNFFDELFAEEIVDDDRLINLWGQAEKAVTIEGVALAEEAGLEPDGFESFFLTTGDLYREIVGGGNENYISCVTAGLSAMGGLDDFLNSGFRDDSQIIAGARVGKQFGEEFVDPRTLWWGTTPPVYWYSTMIWSMEDPCTGCYSYP